MIGKRLAYSRECQLVRAAAELLRFPQPVIATALTFLHRYYAACPDAVKDQEIAPACLFLASKVEEASVRINDLLNAFLYLERPSEPAAVAGSFPGLRFSEAVPAVAAAAAPPAAEAAQLPAGDAAAAAAAGRDSPAAAGEPAADLQPAKLLVGVAYYAAKEQLIHREQVLLRWLGFELCVDHPYRYLLNFANVTRCSEQLARLALSLVNDSLLHTDLSARRPPADVAAGALQLASLLLEAPLAISAAGGRSWAELVGVHPAAADAAGRELLDALEAVGGTQ